MQRLLNPNWGSGFILPAADPVAGANFTAVNALNWHYLIRSVTFRLVADGNAANRYASIVILNSAAGSAVRYLTGTAVTTGLTRDIIFSPQPHSPAETAGNFISAAIPYDLHFPENVVWKIEIVNIQVGDTITGIQPYLDLFPESANVPTLP